MILILLRDGTSVEIPKAFDVIHKGGSIECIDAWGELLRSLKAEDVLAYSLNPRVMHEFFDEADLPNAGRPGTRERVGQASARMRISSQDLF